MGQRHPFFLLFGRASSSRVFVPDILTDDLVLSKISSIISLPALCSPRRAGNEWWYVCSREEWRRMKEARAMAAARGLVQ
jgi:hypothetical protein